MIGSRIGHYEITAEIGRGGMGEVYRARDTKLNRDVALKILPQVFAQDAQRMARFEREAQVLASLNHANIAQIYGIESVPGAGYRDDGQQSPVSGLQPPTSKPTPQTPDPIPQGTQCLVLELVEGQTLQEQIARGPIPVDEALTIALQICEGLEAAHEKGIIHRDLKPANIKITPEGQVKILDFGLAKAMDDTVDGQRSTVHGLSHSPTLTQQPTQAGVILGTAAYMSPEQARGKPVDKRTDIWAFGCVLYEMLTGKRAFGGDSDETVSDVLAAVLRADPNWGALPVNANLWIRRLIGMCMRKDTRDRLHDIGDVRIEISEAHDDSLHPDSGTSPSSRVVGLSWMVSLLSILLAVVFFSFWMVSNPTPSARLPVLSTIVLPEGAPLAPAGVQSFGIGRPSLALSAEGKHLVYVALVGTQTQLYLRDMTTGLVEPIPKTEGARAPCFSPDGNWLAFFAGEKLAKVPLSGGEPITLAMVSSLEHGVAWGEDSWVYYNPNEGQGIWRVSPDGANTEPWTEINNQTFYHAWPEPLANMSGLLYTDANNGGVFATKIKGEEGIQVLPEGTFFARYARTGHLVYATNGRLSAVRFDLDRLEVVGSPVVLFDDLRTDSFGAAHFTLSLDGTLVLVPGDHQEMGVFTWLDREGNREQLDLPRRNYGEFRLSPNGRYLAFALFGEGEFDLFLYDFQTGVEQRLTSGGGHGPRWSPNGRFLAYTKEGFLDTWVQPLDRSSEPAKVAEGFRPVFFSSDTELVVSNNQELAMVSLEMPGGPNDFKVETIKAGSYVFPSLSPDGRWLAYTGGAHDTEGRWEIFVSPYPSMDRSFQISQGGGEEPRWNPNGKEITYRSIGGGIPKDEGERWGTEYLSVDLELEAEFEAGRPRVLFEGPFINLGGYSWDISSDGKRFLLIENEEHQSEPVNELVLISNFFDLLREKVPAE